jgi:hypothetical protein
MLLRNTKVDREVWNVATLKIQEDDLVYRLKILSDEYSSASGIQKSQHVANSDTSFRLL